MILVDPRVGSKHLAPLFDALKVEYDVTPLEFGDCMFIGNGPEGPITVGIEIKGGRGGSDFLQSMQSDRLVGHQVPGLCETYDRRYLIIEGIRPTKSGLIWTPPRRVRTGGAFPVMGRGQGRPMFLADVKRFVTGLEESGLRVRWTATPTETAAVIVKELLAFWSKEYDDHSSISALYRPALFSLRREDEATKRLRRVAICLPGIGIGRSKAVAERFQSIYGLVTADESAWEGIEGVGKKISGDVIRALHARAEKEPRTRGSETPRTLSDRRVSKGRRAVARSPRSPRKRQDRELDAGRRAERRVPPTP